MPHDPLAYFITLSTYGSWLHGKQPGSVDVEHNQFETPFLPGNPDVEMEMRSALSQPPYVLDLPRRVKVLATMCEVCQHRGWNLLACHVRMAHVHVVVAAPVSPEKVMNDFKAYASRRLTEAGFDSQRRKRWTRHGSTRYVWNDDGLINVLDYVLNQQGEPMQVYRAEEVAKYGL